MKQQILVFGGLLLDHYVAVDHLPERGGDGMIQAERTFVGGCAINMAVTAQNLIRSSQSDVTVHVVSGLGEDETSQQIEEYMSAHDLSMEYVERVAGTTGKCYVFVEPDGERTFLTKKGVEADFSEKMTQKIMEGGCLVAGVTGYYLLNKDARKVVKVLKKLKEQGTIILFDPSPLVHYIDPVVLGGMLEIADVMKPSGEELSEEDYRGKIVIKSEGAKGGQVISPEGSFHYDSVKCQAVDTTGAGDSFSGALLYGLSQKMPLEVMVEKAAQAAAKTVEVYGPHGFWRV